MLPVKCLDNDLNQPTWAKIDARRGDRMVEYKGRVQDSVRTEILIGVTIGIA